MTVTMARLRTRARFLREWIDECFPGPDSEASPDNPRWLSVVVLCCLVSIICSIDRTTMSVAIIPFSAKYGWNGSVKGAVSRCGRLHKHQHEFCMDACKHAHSLPSHVLSSKCLDENDFAAVDLGDAR